MTRFFSTLLTSLQIITIFLSGSTLYAKSSDDIQHILQGINHFRLMHLLPPLKLDQSLSAIASTHSQNMAKHVYPMGHQGFEKRFARIRQIMPGTQQASENVAYGYRNVDEVIQGWIRSPGHRANILGSFRLTGIAIAHDERGRPYYTQIFCKPS